MLIVPLLFHADPTLRGSRRARSPRCILGLRTPLKVATPAADCASGGQWGSKNEEGALKTETRSEHALPKSSHPPSHPTCFQQLATLPLYHRVFVWPFPLPGTHLPFGESGCTGIYVSHWSVLSSIQVSTSNYF